MWVKLKAAAEDNHPITGILNPDSGPNVFGGALSDYQSILNTFLDKGQERADPDSDIAALTVRKIMRAKKRSER